MIHCRSSPACPINHCNLLFSAFNNWNYYLQCSRLLQVFVCWSANLLHQACRVLQLMLVMPATNATCERSFSALCRVKGYLLSIMTQQKLNNLMILHVHKEGKDSLNQVDITNDLVGDSEHRLRMFGLYIHAVYMYIAFIIVLCFVLSSFCTKNMLLVLCPEWLEK